MLLRTSLYFALRAALRALGAAPGGARRTIYDFSRVRIHPFIIFNHRAQGVLWLKMAEREGFEPSIEVNLSSLSRGVPSATRPPLRSTFSKIP